MAYSVSASPNPVNENAGIITFTVARSSPNLGAETVFVSTAQTEGSTNSSDYSGLSSQSLFFCPDRPRLRYRCRSPTTRSSNWTRSSASSSSATQAIRPRPSGQDHLDDPRQRLGRATGLLGVGEPEPGQRERRVGHVHRHPLGRIPGRDAVRQHDANRGLDEQQRLRRAKQLIPVLLLRADLGPADGVDH